MVRSTASSVQVRGPSSRWRSSTRRRTPPSPAHPVDAVRAHRSSTGSSTPPAALPPRAQRTLSVPEQRYLLQPRPAVDPPESDRGAQRFAVALVSTERSEAERTMTTIHPDHHSRPGSPAGLYTSIFEAVETSGYRRHGVRRSTSASGSGTDWAWSQRRRRDGYRAADLLSVTSTTSIRVPDGSRPTVRPACGPRHAWASGSLISRTPTATRGPDSPQRRARAVSRLRSAPRPPTSASLTAVRAGPWHPETVPA